MLALSSNSYRLHKSIRTEHARQLSVSSIATKGSFASALEDHPGKNTESGLMLQFADEPMVSHIPSKQEAMLDKLLVVSSQNKSFESFKLKAYIRECWEVKHVDDDFPTGVHQDRYQEFIGGMCQYIVDKPTYSFLSYDAVFAKLEHHLMPEIYSRVQEHVSRPEDDAKLARFGKNLAFLSQSQFGIKPECQDISLSPYYAAISALKASSMCLIPTRKIFQIVRAAKLVFENLNEIAAQDNRSPPGADEFMDVWVYVVLKANIPKLASTVAYLKKYCNPNLAFTEAGYYLSSVEFACQYILRLNEHEFPVHQGKKIDKIVVCEQRRYRQLASEGASVFEAVSENEWLKGYQMFAVKEWQLDPLRYFSTVLVPTDDQSAKVKVSVVRVNKEVVSASQLEYLKSCFLEPSAAHGLASVNTHLGSTVILYSSNAQRSLTLIPIKSGQYDEVEDSLKWYCTLERLSCIQPRNQTVRMNPENTSTDTELDKSGDTKRKVQTQCLSSDLTLLHLHSEHSEHEGLFDNSIGITDSLEKKEPMDIISTDFVLDAAQHKNVLVQSVYYNDEEKKTASNLMTVLLNYLYILGYLSHLIDIPEPYFNNVIVLAVRHFQLDYNSYSPDDTLPTSGHLTPATLKALTELLKTTIEKLNRLGFHFEGELHLSREKEWIAFSKFVSHCQDSMVINIHMKGALDRQTREEIDRLVADLRCHLT
ncbi:uncharacterized protein LOC116303436 isoform X2 [Actinia tenebrosa]|uniref:Uncharacterized protein LOC116303436 isoform X2 n=1 Tax=Actinia tenebrosa TaxID=6105 RepID=A0A6P8IP66_ACTTE|nr:uncharacterized protein LOC116303436 isoform X2 [Actinia tenebrosa]